ncbi:SGNH hydrolase-type esterase domain-containing protein [Xylaria bambusicola]|uniref:SGNH hydrolase-type esterase domain-containing protein n=1 Tax=Xylaria bambusicola TaxID=326684 RepID=UPI00200822BC|nr:SGNH hydrolase-type esterase domain-containing protein [Xylaria bambusicola]KAI0508703.1 SGNH hydrolase-type esterase domain-containing protein [Xylaria bambusicola]
MGFFSIISALRTLLVFLPAAASLQLPRAKPPAFFLAGDSTTAVVGGWGRGLLNPLIEPAWGINFGLSGATTESFKARGYWGNLTEHVRRYAATNDAYVTISFGHNDQKADSGVSFELYQQNLIDFANEVKSLGGSPLLVSSLTRRVFPRDQPHNATDSLHAQRLAALHAADVTNSTVVDLNAASLAYVDAIGRDASWEYNYSGDDYTHLNPYGEVVFGRMVADLIVRAKPVLEMWIAPNETLSYALWNNLPA